MSIDDLDVANKKVAIYDLNTIWLDTMYTWCRNVYKFGEVHKFTNKAKLLEYIAIENPDVAIVNFYDITHNTDNSPLIEDIREITKELLVIAISADFISDSEVLDTEQMKKALYAGANRATIKNIVSLKMIIEEHLIVRNSAEYQTMIKDKYNKKKEDK